MGLPRAWTVGDVSASQTLTDDDHLYPAHINEIRTTLDTFYSVKDYGAVGDGVTDDSAAFIAAYTAGDYSFRIPVGTYRISADITLPSGTSWIFDNGAKLSVDSGKTVTFRGIVHADPYQIFSGLGTVTGLKYVNVKWFGADPTGVADSQPMLQAAMDCVANSSSSDGDKYIVDITNGTYLVSSTWTIKPSVYCSVRVIGSGTGLNQSRITTAAGSDIVAVLVDAGTGLNGLVDFQIKDFAIIGAVDNLGTGLKINDTVGHKIYGFQESLIENIHINDFLTGLFMQQTRLINFNRVSVWNNTLTTPNSVCVKIRDTILSEASAFSGDMDFDRCQFVGPTGDTTTYGVDIECILSGNTMAGIRFNKCIFYKNYVQILLASADGAGIGDVWIDKCQFDGAMLHGIKIVQAGTSAGSGIGDIHITNNYFTSVNGNCVRMEAALQDGINYVTIAHNWSGGVAQSVVTGDKCKNINIGLNNWGGVYYPLGQAIYFNDSNLLNIQNNIFGKTGTPPAGVFQYMVLLTGTGDYYNVIGNNSGGNSTIGLISDTTGAVNVEEGQNI